MGWRWGAQGEVVGGWLGVWADVFGCSATPTRCRAPLCARLALVLAVAAVADDEENARCGGAPSALGSVRCGGLQAGAGRGRLLTGGWAGRWGGGRGVVALRLPPPTPRAPGSRCRCCRWAGRARARIWLLLLPAAACESCSGDHLRQCGSAVGVGAHAGPLCCEVARARPPTGLTHKLALQELAPPHHRQSGKGGGLVSTPPTHTSLCRLPRPQQRGAGVWVGGGDCCRTSAARTSWRSAHTCSTARRRGDGGHVLQGCSCCSAHPVDARSRGVSARVQGCRAGLPQAVPLCVGPEGVVAAARRCRLTRRTALGCSASHRLPTSRREGWRGCQRASLYDMARQPLPLQGCTAGLRGAT